MAKKRAKGGKPGDKTKSARRRGRPKGTQQRRRDILRAALAVFAEAGYERRVTMQEIVRRAGTSKGALYHYFESKEAVLIALVDELLVPPLKLESEFVIHAATAVGTEELLERVVGRIWTILQDPERNALARVATTEMPRLPEVGRIYFDEVVARGRMLLRRAMLHGRTASPEELARVEAEAAVVQAMLVGAALVRHAFEPFDPPPLAPTDFTRVVTRLVLHGLTPGSDRLDAPHRSPR